MLERQELSAWCIQLGVFDWDTTAGVDLMTSGRFIKSLKKSFVSSS